MKLHPQPWLLLVWVGCSLPALAQEKDPEAVRYANTITVNDLREHLTIIASDSFEGRETGERGQKLAADYIARQFAENNLRPPVMGSEGKTYLQSFEVREQRWGEMALRVKGKSYEFLEDYYPAALFDIPQPNEWDVVFAGYGIEDERYSDYQDLDVAGKAVLILAGEPQLPDGRYVLTGDKNHSGWAEGWNRKTELAQRKGAAAVFQLRHTSDREFTDYLNRYIHYLEGARMSFEASKTLDSFGTFVVKPTVAARMAGTSLKKLAIFLNPSAEPKLPRWARKERPVVVQADRIETSVQTENVLGLVEGSDLKDEVVVITAHYDHVGRRDTAIYNGADDDGSGTVAVLELAQAFATAKAEGHGPRRSLLFMTFTGEEKGLLGSNYYSDYPVIPMDSTVADLNIDMIGRLDEAHSEPDYIYIIGSTMLSSELHAVSEAANATYSQLNLDYKYNRKDDPNRFYYRSDHYNFAKNGVPVIFYFSGVHEDYHRPTDEVGKIHFEKMEKVTRLVFYTAWQLANQPQRIKVDQVQP